MNTLQHHYSLIFDNSILPNNFIMDMNQLLTMRNENIVNIAKNDTGSKLIKLYLQHHGRIRQKFYHLLLNPLGNFLVQLSCDLNANFIVQVFSFFFFAFLLKIRSGSPKSYKRENHFPNGTKKEYI